LAECRRARRVDRHDEISLVRKYVWVPPRGPPIVPHSLRASVYEQKSGPLLLVAFLPSVRFDDITMHFLPFRSFEVKVLRRAQRFPHQRFLGEPSDLLRLALPLEVDAPSLGQFRFELGEPADNEHVVRALK